MKSSAKLVKYREILGQIERDIRSGKYPPGKKLPSEAVLVRRYSTSRITVGRAFQELVQKGFVIRRPGSGSYVRSDIAAQPSSDRLFGLLIPDLGETEIYEPICQGMAGAPQGSALVWGSTTINAETKEAHALALCHQYVEQKVSGVFFAPLHSVSPADSEEANLRIIGALAKASIPVVLIDRDIVPYPKRSPFDLIGIDNRKAGYMIAEHLIERGCKRIGFISYRNPSPTVQARIAWFREAVFTGGTVFGQRFIQTIDVSQVSVVRRVIHSIRPDGLVCCNDLTAGQLMHSLIELGHQI